MSSFQILKESKNSAARFGIIKIKEKVLHTPAVISGTRRGILPHLTNDMALNLFPVRSINVGDL